MARKFAVIGLGTFGFQVACELEELGGEVLAIDRNESVIQEIRDRVSRAVVCDAHDRDSLREVGVGEVDAVIIGLRSRLDSSILTTMYIQEMGVDEIIVQAVSDDHRRALEKIGATRVIFPEKDMATRVASHVLLPNLIDYLWAGGEYGLVEVKAPEAFVGKTLLELNVRREYGVTVVAVRRGGIGEDGEPHEPVMPSSDYEFEAGDILLVIGKSDDLTKFSS